MDSKEKVKGIIEQFLEEIKKEATENISNYIKESAQRVADLWLDKLLDGYKKDPKRIIREGRIIFNSDQVEIISIKDIKFFSFCPHHLIPYVGSVDIYYIPERYIIGFSKFIEVVDSFAHRFVLQEELAESIAKAIYEYLPAKSVLCKLSSVQLCQVINNNSRVSEIKTMAIFGEEDFKSLLLNYTK